MTTLQYKTKEGKWQNLPLNQQGGDADWNAQEGEAGYIKNKPFGEIETLVFKQENVTISNQSGNGYGPLNANFINEFTYKTDITYTVVINDKVYSNLSPSPNNGFLANDYTGSPAPLFTNADFTLMCSNGAAYGSMYFKEPLENGTVTIYANTIKKLDNKYVDQKGINKIIINELEYNPYESNGENIVKFDVAKSVTLNGVTHVTERGGIINIGDVVTSVTIDGERQTGDVNLDDLLPIVQEIGNSETSLMSQKAVTEALKNVGGANWDAEAGESGYISNKPEIVFKRTSTGGIALNQEGQNPILGNMSMAFGTGVSAKGDSSLSIGQWSHADGNASAAFGSSTASGNNSFAIGSICVASGADSFACGNRSQASGPQSYAEGNGIAEGTKSHAEGNNTTAKGSYSHTEGSNTIAYNQAEHASGIYNISKAVSGFGQSEGTLFTVGNGSIGFAHNAFEVRQDGSIYIPNTSAEGAFCEKPMICLQDAIRGSLQSFSTLVQAETATTQSTRMRAKAQPTMVVEAGKQYYNDEENKVISEYNGFSAINQEAKILSKYPMTFAGENVIVENTSVDADYLMYSLKYMQISEEKYLIAVSVNSFTSNGGDGFDIEKEEETLQHEDN